MAKHYKTIFLFLFLFKISLTFSSSIDNHLLQIPANSGEKAPWFTGPLLAPSAHTIPPGHVNFEPYLFFFTKTGSYNKHKKIKSAPHFYTLLSQNPIQIGITPWMDCQIIPQLFYKFTQGVRSTQPGDLPIAFDFQLFNSKEKAFQPALKLTLKGVLPFGKFEDLSPLKLGTDGVGTGSFLPTVAFTFSRLIPLGGIHYLETRLNVNYTLTDPVHVQGLNVYGGATDTRGKVYPGNVLNSDFGFELTLSQNWVFAMDVNYIYTNKTKFFGNPGTLGTMWHPSSEQLSLAPAIEYNWNINVGMIAGAWFTVAGRNASRFATSVIALNLYL